MDFSFLADVDNPMSMVVVIVFLFTGAVFLIWKQSAAQNSRLMDKFIERSEKQNERLVDVLEKNAISSTKQALTNEELASAVSRLGDIVDRKLEAKQ